MIKKYLPSILFNLGEVLVILLGGLLLQLDIKYIAIIVLSFIIGRLVIGEPKHYKAWQLCLLWTTVIFMTLFLVGKIDIVIASLIAIFNALIISGRADISDIFQWKQKKVSKYEKELEYVKYNPQRLAEFENILESENDNFTFLVYKYIFKERMTWQETADKLETGTNRLDPTVDKIAFAIRIYCKI